MPEGYRLERGLLWPAQDKNAAAVLFDQVSDLDAIYGFCRKFDAAVQAGGHCGLWPKAMAEKFRIVYTFEPDPANFRCLCANALGEKIFKINAALGARHECVGLNHRPLNCGAHQVDGAGDIPTLTVDDLNLNVCDLIYLDVEGYEMRALEGAQNTIERCRPVITIEDKGMSERYGIAAGATTQWVQDRFGYKIAARLHRDVVLVP